MLGIKKLNAKRQMHNLPDKSPNYTVGDFMFGKKKNNLNKKLDKVNDILEKSNVEEIAYLLGNRKQVFFRNLLAGVSKGIGTGIGVTIVTSLLIYFLQKIVTLNIPVIGDFISDIIDIVQINRY